MQMVIDDLEEKVAEQSQIQSEMTVTKCPTRDNSLNALKILKDIRSLGCSKNEVSAATYRTYFDLCEVRKYESVDYYYSHELDYLYLKVTKNANQEQKIVIPILATKTVSFEEMEKFQKAFSTDSIKLAVTDTSSTIMYYDLKKS